MTKHYILQHAVDEFAHFGYEGFSTNKFSQKIELNKATIYYHFKDKKNLYQEVLLYLSENNTDGVTRLMGSEMNSRRKLEGYIRLYVQSIKKHPQIVPIGLRETANYGSGIDDIFAREIARDMEQLETIIAGLPLKAKYKKYKAHEIKAFISGTVKTYYAMQRSSAFQKSQRADGEILDHIGSFVTDCLLDALCEDKGE